MQRGIMWVLAMLVAGLALVAGCFQVEAPKQPLVVVGDGSTSSQPSAEDRSRVQGMDKQDLENEVLRLTAENDRLRQEVGKLEQDKKKLKEEKKQLKDRVDRLEDQVDDLKDHR